MKTYDVTLAFFGAHKDEFHKKLGSQPNKETIISNIGESFKLADKLTKNRHLFFNRWQELCKEQATAQPEALRPEGERERKQVFNEPVTLPSREPRRPEQRWDESESNGLANRPPRQSFPIISPTLPQSEKKLSEENAVLYKGKTPVQGLDTIIPTPAPILPPSLAQSIPPRQPVMRAKDGRLLFTSTAHEGLHSNRPGVPWGYRPVQGLAGGPIMQSSDIPSPLDGSCVAKFTQDSQLIDFEKAHGIKFNIRLSAEAPLNIDKPEELGMPAGAIAYQCIYPAVQSMTPEGEYAGWIAQLSSKYGPPASEGTRDSVIDILQNHGAPEDQETIQKLKAHIKSEGRFPQPTLEQSTAVFIRAIQNRVAEALENTPKETLRPEMRLLLTIGGYIYWSSPWKTEGSGKSRGIAGINALDPTPPSDPSSRFQLPVGQAQIVSENVSQSIDEMVRTGQMWKITVGPLYTSGLRDYCWIAEDPHHKGQIHPMIHNMRMALIEKRTAELLAYKKKAGLAETEESRKEAKNEAFKQYRDWGAYGVFVYNAEPKENRCMVPVVSKVESIEQMRSHFPISVVDKLNQTVDLVCSSECIGCMTETPVMKPSGCNHISYCQDCFESWQETQKRTKEGCTCPICRKVMGETVAIIDPPAAVHTKLSRLEIGMGEEELLGHAQAPDIANRLKYSGSSDKSGITYHLETLQRFVKLCAAETRVKFDKKDPFFRGHRHFTGASTYTFIYPLNGKSMDQTYSLSPLWKALKKDVEKNSLHDFHLLERFGGWAFYDDAGELCGVRAAVSSEDNSFAQTDVHLTFKAPKANSDEEEQGKVRSGWGNLIEPECGKLKNEKGTYNLARITHSPIMNFTSHFMFTVVEGVPGFVYKGPFQSYQFLALGEITDPLKRALDA